LNNICLIISLQTEEDPIPVRNGSVW